MINPAFTANDLVVALQHRHSLSSTAQLSKLLTSRRSQTRGNQGTGGRRCAFIQSYDVSKATAGYGEACGRVEESELLRRLLGSGDKW